MLSYKTSTNILFITVSFVIVTDILMFLHVINGDAEAHYVNIATSFLQLICLHTIKQTLQKHGEGKLKIFSVYAIMFMMFVFIGDDLLGLAYVAPGQNGVAYIQFQMLVMFVWLIVYTFYTINILTVKDISLKRYFKLYGFALIICGYGGLVFQLCLSFVLNQTPLFAYGKYIYDVIILLPFLLLARIYYRIKTGQQIFNIGDQIVSRSNFAGLPAGTTGVVVTKHQGLNTYEVEFIDTGGHLINVLTIQAGNIEHVPVWDLETKVNNWRTR